VGFAVLKLVGRRFADKMFDGDMASLYLIWYPVGRLLVESLRPDAWTLSGTGIPTAQVVSLGLMLIGAGTFWYRRYNPNLQTRPKIIPPHRSKRRRTSGS
jgi:phosphatidylglycerol:prolipoprotein diacylglycerol transferase